MKERFFNKVETIIEDDSYDLNLRTDLYIAYLGFLLYGSMELQDNLFNKVKNIINLDINNKSKIKSLTKEEIKTLEDGYYFIYTRDKNNEPHKVCLVYLYTNPDTNQRGFGYGVQHGSVFIPLTDISSLLEIVPVDFTDEQKQLYKLSKL